MSGILASRPGSFSTEAEAISWALRTGTCKNKVWMKVMEDRVWREIEDVEEWSRFLTDSFNILTHPLPSSHFHSHPPPLFNFSLQGGGYWKQKQSTL
jgi:hypothetical protein